MSDSVSDSPELWSLREESGHCTLLLRGHWSAQSAHRQPSSRDVLEALPETASLDVDATGIDGWEGGSLPALLHRLQQAFDHDDHSFQLHSDDDALEALLALASHDRRESLSASETDLSGQINGIAWRLEEGIRAVGTSVYDYVRGLGRLARGKVRFRVRDLIDILFQSGVQALPIITLVSLLLGSILAFVGSLQLRDFGAEIFVAELVGIAVAREMAAMMTAIVMAGRTGAAFAAHLATMQVNEEVDALQTLGLPPYDFLAFPRILALTLMVPLLFVYAALVSMFGGMLVSAFALGLEPMIYIQRTLDNVALYHFQIGLLKSVCFGALIGLVSCHVGLRAGRSAAAVGQAATRAVVISIVGIIVLDSLFAIVSTITGV